MAIVYALNLLPANPLYQEILGQKSDGLSYGSIVIYPLVNLKINYYTDYLDI